MPANFSIRLPRFAAPLMGLLMALALIGCSHERPSSLVTLVVPVQWGVNTVDTSGVYRTVSAYLDTAGLKQDKSRSDAVTGKWVSKPVRCAPNSDERHVAMCVFAADVAPSTTNPLQVAVDLHIHAGDLVEYDPNLARDQIAIEPMLDRVVTELRAKYGFAQVTNTMSLRF